MTADSFYIEVSKSSCRPIEVVTDGDINQNEDVTCKEQGLKNKEERTPSCETVLRVLIKVVLWTESHPYPRHIYSF